MSQPQSDSKKTATQDNLSYVLATTRPWNEDLVSILEERTGRPFFLVTRPEELTTELLSEIKPRYVFFPHWSCRVPREVYERYECVMFHMTDLPFGRGGSPLQNLIARGIYATKISAFRCVEELDAGPVYSKRDLSLYGTAEEIYLRARTVVAEMIQEIVEGTPEPVPQEESPTIFSRRKPEDGNLEAVEDLQQLFDFIRMLDAEGYPKAFLEVGRFRLEFSRAALKHGSVLADVRIVERDRG